MTRKTKGHVKTLADEVLAAARNDPQPRPKGAIYQYVSSWFEEGAARERARWSISLSLNSAFEAVPTDSLILFLSRMIEDVRVKDVEFAVERFVDALLPIVSSNNSDEAHEP